jgi:hypothetical protein
MNITKCPNLVEWVDWVILLCEKGNKPYVPDVTELRKYCKSEDYRGCPYYTTSNNAAKSSSYSDGTDNQKDLCE